jgi:hypothetical protein
MNGTDVAQVARRCPARFDTGSMLLCLRGQMEREFVLKIRLPLTPPEQP